MPEAGLHLIEDQDDPVTVSKACAGQQVARLRLDDADVLQDRLGEEARDGIVSKAHSTASRSLKFRTWTRTAHATGMPADRGTNGYSPRNARADLLQRRHHVAGDFVVPAVVAALHHDDVIAAGEGPGEPQGVVGRLGAGAGDLHLVERRHAAQEQLGATAFPGRRAGAHQGPAFVERPADGGVHLGIGVAEQVRGEGGVIIE